MKSLIPQFEKAIEQKATNQDGLDLNKKKKNLFGGDKSKQNRRNFLVTKRATDVSVGVKISQMHKNLIPPEYAPSNDLIMAFSKQY